VIAALVAAVDPDEARRDAERILRDRRFQSDPAPRPFRGPLRWIGDRLEPVVNWIGDVLGKVPGLMWIFLGILGVVAVVTYIVLKIRRSTTLGGHVGDGTFDSGVVEEDPAALEREADEAERDGELERAVRLRFRAGLVRLGKRGAITYRPSVTTGEVRRALGSETFDELAGTFESVTYGGKPAEQPDVAAARQDWPRVLDEAGRK
jgi:hypothetical protein